MYIDGNKFSDGTQTQAALDALYSLDLDEELPGKEYIEQFETNSYFKDAVCARAKALGYDGASDEELITFLAHCCSQAGVALSRQTITNWIQESAPTGSTVGRENVYKLCFALSMDENQTAEFFLKAFLEKPFQFKRVQECVYYYCLKNGLPYEKAEQLLAQIEQTPAPVSEFCEDNTVLIGQAISAIRNEDKLVQYITENREGFSVQNKTALEKIRELLEKCYEIATEEQKQEQQWHSDEKEQKQKRSADKYSRQVKTPDALLAVIYGYAARATEKDKDGNRYNVYKKSISKSSFPKAIKTNFPQRQQFEYILKGKGSNDAIRKALIVLDFYSFFGEAAAKKIDLDDPFDEFTDELNLLLETCGYEQMYWRNPFDWMIGYSAFADVPLDEFRGLIDAFYLSRDEE